MSGLSTGSDQTRRQLRRQWYSAGPAPWAVLAIFSIAIAACATLSLREHFEPNPGLIPAHGAPHDDRRTDDLADADAGADDEIPLYKDDAPPGFAWAAGEPIVQVGYRHQILGRVSYLLEDGRCDPSGGEVLGEPAIFQRLRRRAREVGGNAIIYAKVHGPHMQASDCERLRVYKVAGHEAGPWASGVIVWLDDGELDADGGVADFGGDDPRRPRTQPQGTQRSRREDELPPPLDSMPHNRTAASSASGSTSSDSTSSAPASASGDVSTSAKLGVGIP